MLATFDADATVLLWNLTDPARPSRLGEPLTGPTAPVAAVGTSGSAAARSAPAGPRAARSPASWASPAGSVATAGARRTGVTRRGTAAFT